RSTMLTVSLIMMYALLLVNVGNYISGAAAIATVLKINLSWAMCVIAGISTMVDGLPPEYFSLTGKIGAPTVIAWTIGTIGAIFSTQFIMQAVSGAHNADDARRSTFYAAALCFPLAIALGLIGVA